MPVIPRKSGVFSEKPVSNKQPLSNLTRSLSRRSGVPAAERDESPTATDEVARTALPIRLFRAKETLAVKTGDLRGALEGGWALTRSCAG
jgi:hypothetical protein